MGNFYVNHTIKCGDQNRVVETLRPTGRTAIVGPAENGYVVVFDEQSDTQREEPIEAVGRLLSAGLSAPVLAVLNHDDDILCYWLYEKGERTDHYNSCPHYFDGMSGEEESNEAGRGGDAERLCRALGVPEVAEQGEAVLRESDEPFAVMRHQRLAELLRLPDYSVGAGFRYVEEDDAELDPDSLIRLP